MPPCAYRVALSSSGLGDDQHVANATSMGAEGGEQSRNPASDDDQVAHRDLPLPLGRRGLGPPWEREHAVESPLIWSLPVFRAVAVIANC